MNELISIEELKKQIWEKEGVKVDVQLDVPRLVRPYNYEPLPNDATVDDLKDRIYECIKPFIFQL